VKKILIYTFLLTFIVAAFSGIAFAKDEVPNLVGTWVSTSSHMHMKDLNFVKPEAPLKFIVEKQQGRAFTGKKIWVANGKEQTENFSGVVALDNKRFYTAEHVDGLVIGDIISKDKMAIYYIVDGKNAKVILHELERKKK
jgi:hypothetical protein